MPRINKIRVTNIRYDNGQKLYPDLILDANSSDLLVILANGGGKTLLLQLILQVVIPNAQIKNRRIAGLLSSERYTGHVLVEWLLDTPEKEYLLTGFCFTNGRDDQPVRYFNYLHHYDRANPLDLESLSLIDEEHRPIAYAELYELLKSHTGAKLQVFDQRSAYQQELERYHIYPDEWEKIRLTNGSEGGVDEFFRGSRSTKNLLENLLIPAVEDVLFQTDADKKEMANAFDKYRQHLLELPQMKKNIEDFRIIREGAQGVIDALAAHKKASEHVESARQKTARLWLEFDDGIKEKTNVLEKLKRRLEEVEGIKTELEWKIASYPYFVKNLEKEELEADLAEATGNFDMGSVRLKSEKQTCDQLKGLFYLERIMQRRANIESLRAKIRNVLSSEPERGRQLQKARQDLAGAWLAKQEQFQERQEAFNGKVVRYEQALDELERENRRLQKQQTSLLTEKGVIKEWLDETGREYDHWVQKEGPEVAGDPVGAVEQWSVQQSDLLEKLDERKHALESLEEESRHIRNEFIELTEHLSETRRELEKYHDDLEAFYDTEERLRGELTRFDVYARHLHGEQDRIREKLYELDSRLQQEYAKALAGFYNLQEKMTLSEKTDYFIPHPQIESVRQALEKRGIPAVSGSQWLRMREHGPRARWGYLWYQPLLPYSLIVESRHVDWCRKELQRLVEQQEIDADFPVILIERSETALKPSDGATGLNGLGPAEKGVYIFQSNTLEVFTSEEAFENWAQQLGQRHEQAKDESEQLREQIQGLAEMMRQVEDFYDRYSEKTIQLWHNRLHELNEQHRQLTGRQEQLESREQAIEGEVKAIKPEIARMEKEDRKLDLLIRQIEPYKDRYRQRGKYLAEQERLDQLLGEITSEIEKCKDCEKECQRQKEEAQRQLDDLQREHDEHYRLVQELMGGELPRALQVMENESSQSEVTETLDLDIAVARVKSLMDSLKSLKDSIEDWEHQIDREQKDIDADERMLQGLGVERAWLENNRRPMDWSEVEVQEARVNEVADEVEQAKKVVDDLKSKVDGIDGELKGMARYLQQSFHLPPFDGFDRYIHEDEYRKLQRKQAELEESNDNLQKNIKAEEAMKNALSRAYQRLMDDWPTEWMSLQQWYAHWVRDGKSESDQSADEANRWDWEKGADPEAEARLAHREIQDLLRKQRDTRDEVNRAFRSCQDAFRRVENVSLHQFARHLAGLEQGGHLYDYDLVFHTFENIFNALDRYEEQYAQRLEEVEENRAELVRRAVGRAERMIRELKEIPHFSSIELYGRDVQMMKIELPTHDPHEFSEIMGRYINELIDDLNARRLAGDQEDELRRIIDDRLSSRNILNVLIPLERCRIGVVKPQKESMIANRRISYEPWDKVALWSGGEEYSAYMSVFIVLITYVRRRKSGHHRAWKVIVADNPFGKASSPHILEVVFRMAARNRVQFLCLTAHRDESILRCFRVVYSLKLYPTIGREVVQQERIETGHYLVEDIDGSGDEQQVKMAW